MATDTIQNIVEEIAFRYKNTVYVTFVGYRDYGDSKRIEFLEFTKDVDKFKTFLKGITAEGGDDKCEHVFGGLQKVLELKWKHQTRCLVYIADAPCHGNRFHDLKGSGKDNYSENNEQDHKGLRIENLISGLKEKNISYFLGKFNCSTDKMFSVFKEVDGDDFNCYSYPVKNNKDFIRQISIFSVKPSCRDTQ